MLLIFVPFIYMMIVDSSTHSWGRRGYIGIGALVIGYMNNVNASVSPSGGFTGDLLLTGVFVLAILLADFTFDRGLFVNIDKSKLHNSQHKTKFILNYLKQQWLQLSLIIGVIFLASFIMDVKIAAIILGVIIVILVITCMPDSSLYDKHKAYYNRHHIFGGSSNQIHDYWYRYHFFG